MRYPKHIAQTPAALGPNLTPARAMSMFVASFGPVNASSCGSVSYNMTTASSFTSTRSPRKRSGRQPQHQQLRAQDGRRVYWPLSDPLLGVYGLDGISGGGSIRKLKSRHHSRLSLAYVRILSAPTNLVGNKRLACLTTLTVTSRYDSSWHLRT